MSLSSGFNINYEELKNIIKNTNAFIAGGFVLNSYNNNNIEYTLETSNLWLDQDIDIFIRTPNTFIDNHTFPKKYIYKLGYLPYTVLAKEYINNILKSKNYIKQQANQNKWGTTTNEMEYRDCALSHFIINIDTYINNDTKRKIQIIYLYDCYIEEFLNTFDLNICKLAIIYNYNTDKLDFYHNIKNYIDDNELQLINNKLMYIHISLYTNNLTNRIIKYYDRGYKLIDKKDKKIIFNYLDEDDKDELYKFICSKYKRLISYNEYIKISLNELD